MSDTVLKPCPYCGGPAELREGEECAYVQCLNAKFHRGPFVNGDNNAAVEAADEWNRRHDCTSPLIEALERIVDHVDHLAAFARVDAKVKRKAAAREPGTPYAVECLRNAEDSDAEEARHASIVSQTRDALQSIGVKP